MITIWTDGAAKGNPGPGGYGTILRYGEKEKEISEGFRLTTNNRMELLAVIVGLETIKKEGWKVLVVSDSKYVVDAVMKGWLKNWVKKNFKDKKNRDLWERYLIAAAPHDVRFQWVKGHAGHPENERCDQLAVEASEQPNLKADAEYEKLS
ncbi:MAG: ribonuclease HI [Ekhidna sp.]